MTYCDLKLVSNENDITAYQINIVLSMFKVPNDSGFHWTSV